MLAFAAADVLGPQKISPFRPRSSILLNNGTRHVDIHDDERSRIYFPFRNSMMQIQSTRFGQIQLDQSDILLMPRGLIGFENCRHWVLLSNPANEDVAWLQSLSSPGIALPVVSPRRFDSHYRVQISRRDLGLLHLNHEDQVFVLAVVSKNGQALTMNLKSPILLNASRQLAIQVVCSDERPLAAPIGLTTLARFRQAA
jgi:flagellar assembly factor FliW